MFPILENGIYEKCMEFYTTNGFFYGKFFRDNKEIKFIRKITH